MLCCGASLLLECPRACGERGALGHGSASSPRALGGSTSPILKHPLGPAAGRPGYPKPRLGSGDGTKVHPTQERDITPTIHHVLVPVQSPSPCPIPPVCPRAVPALPLSTGACLSSIPSSGKEIGRNPWPGPPSSTAFGMGRDVLGRRGVKCRWQEPCHDTPALLAGETEARQAAGVTVT